MFLLRSLLGLHPRLTGNQVYVNPQIPPALLPLTIERLPVGAVRARLVIDGTGSWSIDGLAGSLEVRRQAAPDRG
jgi:hypothetical protein